MYVYVHAWFLILTHTPPRFFFLRWFPVYTNLFFFFICRIELNQAKGYIFQMEMIIRARQCGFAIGEVRNQSVPSSQKHAHTYMQILL